PQSKPEVSSSINVTVFKNDGTPFANGYIVFQTGSYGYFSGHKLSDVRMTNSAGNAQITYIIPRGTAAIGDTVTDIKATLSDNGRLDNPLAAIYDIIPIRIIPYDIREMVYISGNVWDNFGNPLPGVIIEVSNNGGVTVTRSPSGSYDILVCWGWTGNITPSLEGYSFVPANYSYTNPLYSDLPNQNFIGYMSAAPALVATPSSITAPQTGIASFDITVTSSVSTITIAYTAQSSDPGWLQINTGSSTYITPGTINITITNNGTGSARTATITIVGTNPQGVTPATVTVTQPG
ncbi:MAG: BACON domain-containing protein, partial [Candidatus Aminicenantes bacterium]|nr:BACON domain-containing protein [Candidatus Aminicenantes bacterium]